MQVKLLESSPSLSQMALMSQGSFRQGSGTAFKKKKLYLAGITKLTASHILEQLNPSPSVNGAWHEQVKFALSNPSLMQIAFGSQGVDRHGSGTETKFIELKWRYY